MIGSLNEFVNKDKLQSLKSKKLIAFELLPRITRAQSMDILSSQAIALDVLMRHSKLQYTNDDDSCRPSAAKFIVEKSRYTQLQQQKEWVQ